MHTFFAYLARMKYIQRWGLMRNSFPENDAEHTLQTVMIAHGLAESVKKFFMNPAMRSIAPCWLFIMMREKFLQAICPLP